MPIINDKALYEKAKKIADEKYSKPSAYKSGYIVKTYKQLGGEYIEDGKEKNLKRWYQENWKSVASSNQYPVLRPTVKVSKKTPLLPSEISNLTEQIHLKQKIKGKNLPPFISQGISMKGKKGRMYGGMDKLPKETLDEISGFIRRPREERPETTPSRLALESGLPKERARNLKEEFSRNYGHPMNARGMRKYEAFLQSQRESEFEIAKKNRVLQGIIIRLFLQRNPDGIIDEARASSDGCVASGKKGRMYGGMDRLPQEALHEISGFLRPPRVHEVQQQFPGYTHRIMPVEHGVREQQRIRDRNVQNLGVMTANRRERLEEARYFVELPVEEQIAEIEAGLPILHVREMYAMTNSNLPYQLLIRYPAIGGSKVRKGGMIPLISADRLNAQYQQNLQQGGPTFQESEARALRIARIRGIESVVMYMIERVAKHTGKSQGEIAGLYRNYIDSRMPQDEFLDLENDQISQILDDFIRMVTAPSEGKGLHKKKGGMPLKDKDIILPPPAVARAVTGEATRPFEGQEVYADFPEAPSVFSDFTLAEEQREIARAEQRNDANIGSLFRQFGQLYPGGLATQGSTTAYNDFTDRYLPSRTMNESYVANLPVAERGRIISAFLRQRQGMCVASGKPKRSSKWIEHVKAHAKKHGVSYKQAMQDSKRTYGGGPSQSKSSKAERHPDEVYTPRSTRGLDTIVERLPERSREAVVSKKLADIQHAQDLQRATRTPLPVSQPHQQVARALRAEQYPTFHYTDAVAVPLNTPPIKPTLKMPEYRERDVSAVDTRRAEKLTQMPDNVELKILQLASNMMTKSPYFDPRKHSMELFHEFMLRNYKRSIKGWYNSDATARKAMMHYYLTGSRNYV